MVLTTHSGKFALMQVVKTLLETFSGNAEEVAEEWALVMSAGYGMDGCGMDDRRGMTGLLMALSGE